MSFGKLNNRDEIGAVLFGASATIKRPVMRNMSIIGAKGVANESITCFVGLYKNDVLVGTWNFTASDEADPDISIWSSLTLQEGDVLKFDIVSGDAGSGATVVLKIS